MTLWILVEFKMHRSFIVNIANPFSYINFKIALEEIFLKHLHFRNKRIIQGTLFENLRKSLIQH